MKSNSAYKLELEPSDLSPINLVYRKEMGLPFFRAAISTNKGIFFVNTVNPTKPEMTILQRSNVSTAIEPRMLFPHFKFSDYIYDQAGFGTYDRWILVFCRTANSLVNDTILLCNIDRKTVDPIKYSGKQSIQVGSNLYVGDSVSSSVYSTFTGFDDLGSKIDAFWTGKDELIGTDFLKKTRRLKFKGRIDPDQQVSIYINLDEQGFQKVGSIWGGASYVNYSDVQAIGGTYIGEAQIGGDDVSSAYGYYMELKVKTGKFRKIAIKLVPEEVGYFDFDTITLWDNLIFENRMPKNYRQKQDVSLDGKSIDQ